MLQEVSTLVQAVSKIAYRHDDIIDNAVDIACGGGGLGCQFADFVGNDCKSTSSLSSPGSFDGSI